jgi:TM2 domain-containing membrane protein YozV
MLHSAYAGNGNDYSNHFFITSPISAAKVQMIQDCRDHFKPINFNLLSVSNPIPSNDQQKLYKDRKKAFIRSLILPGAGELYLGKRSLAKTFFFTEITLWIGYLAFQEYGKWVRDDALAFAATHSGANTEGKPSQFFIDIGNYFDIYKYNDAKQRMFQFEQVYTEEDYFWSWDLDSNRRKFEQMRIASDRALNRSVFVLGGIFANHLISAIHSVWQTHRYNKKIDKMTNSGINLHFDTNYLTGEFLLNIQKEF